MKRFKFHKFIKKNGGGGPKTSCAEVFFIEKGYGGIFTYI